MTLEKHGPASGLNSEAAPHAGSVAWQAEASPAMHDYLAQYLDRVAGMPVLQRVARQAMDLLALIPGEAVLEAGCGVRVFLPLLAGAVGARGQVVGIDHAPAMVAEAQARIAQAALDGVVTVMEGDAYHLPFPDASFDAAHCERVLMHLDDPVAVLREMRRVVRPGGRIVVTEPDWAGMRIDHPDREAFALLYNRYLRQTRQPNLGLSLYRLLAEAGLIERTAAPVFVYETDFDTVKAYGLDLQSQISGLVAEGTLSRERAEAAVAYLDTASRDGTFFSYGGMFIVAGRVPAQ